MPEHGDLTRDQNSGRGIHGVVGLSDFTNEANRRAFSQNSSDAERIGKQTTGTRTGLYLADGSGGWSFVSTEKEEPLSSWADEFWLMSSATFSGSDVFVSCPGGINGASTQLTPQATGPLARPAVSLVSQEGPILGGWGGSVQGVSLSGQAMNAPLASGIVNTSDLYMSLYGSLSFDATLRAFMSADGGTIGVGDTSRAVQFFIESGGTQRGPGPTNYNLRFTYPGYWEWIHEVGVSHYTYFNGELIAVISNSAISGARNATTNNIAIGRNNAGHASVSDFPAMLISGAVVASVKPTVAQRKYAMNVLRGLAAA